MSEKPRLDLARELAEAHLEIQQFGQMNDDLVWNGDTACTHAICQFLSLVWNGTIPTLNCVNEMAGMPPKAKNMKGEKRGMRPKEFEAFLKAAEIPMVVRYGLPFKKLLESSEKAPVFYAMRYGAAPRMTDSHPSGATQTGALAARTRHAVVMLGFLETSAGGGGATKVQVFRKEPNHGSPTRPERPAYDTISDRQARIEYEEYHTVLGNDLYAALPTRALPVAAGPARAVAALPGLTVSNLKPFSGSATVIDGTRSAVQIADRELIKMPAGATKRVFALGTLVPRLPGPPGDRENVVLVGDEAAVLLRADVILRDDAGNAVADSGPVGVDPVAEPPIDVPAGGTPADGDEDRFSNGAMAAD